MEHTVIASSYVFRGTQCFNVSTANRTSSAALAPDHVYAETIVWECDYATAKRGALLWTGGDARGSIKTHLEVCKRLHATGSPEEQEEKEGGRG